MSPLPPPFHVNNISFPLIAIFIIIHATSRICQGQHDAPDQILKKLLDEGHYEKRLRPLSAKPSNLQSRTRRKKLNIKPLMVECTMYVVSLGPVSEVDMTFKLGIYFRQYWRDPRLSFNSTLKQIVLSQDLLEALWLPDSFFQTETESYIHEVTKPNVFFRLHDDGTILMSTRVTVTSRCPMDLRLFPMDTQECELRIASWGFTKTDLQYEWKRDKNSIKNPPIHLADDITLSNFRVVNYQWDSYIRNLSTGEWDTLAVTFRFGRNTLYFIIQMYIPSTLIVMVSWVSFWVGRASVPARAALGITTVLTLLTLISSTNANMPKISYMKAIDVYFAGCFLFVFASLVEFAAVCYLDKSKNPPAKPIPPNSSQSSRRSSKPINTLETHFNQDPRCCAHMLTNDFTGSKTSLQQAVEFTQKHQYRTQLYSSSVGGGSGHHSHKRRRFIHVNLPRKPSMMDEDGDINVGSIDRFSRYFFTITFTVLMVLYWIVYYRISIQLDPVGENGIIL